jgi:hypothetical protein
MAPLVAVPDRRRRVRQRPLHGSQHEGQLQRVVEFPADDVARESVEHGYQIHPPGLQRDVGHINGLLTNDKFCLTRLGRLLLSWSRVEVWQRRVAAQGPTPQGPTPQGPTPQGPTPQGPTPQGPTPQGPHLSCSPGECTRRGGQDETSVANAPVVRHVCGRPSALGPSLPAPAGVEPTSAPAAPKGSEPPRGPGHPGSSERSGGGSCDCA